ncbi:hypothetical protein AU072_11110 [Mycolicibacterium novocastrense]|nr:hypothetical protein AU072_11110 [Mycolicibacterium novocastrense]
MSRYPKPLTLRLAPAPRSHHYTGGRQRSAYGIRREAELFTKLCERCSASVPFDRRRHVTSGQPLTPHRDTMFMQELDDAALTEFVALPKLCSGGAISVCLDQLGDRLSGQPSVHPLHSNFPFKASDRHFCRFLRQIDHPPQPSPLVHRFRVTFQQLHFTRVSLRLTGDIRSSGAARTVFRLMVDSYFG